MTHAQTVDVIIIGAGIAGSAMALALAQQGLRIALLDKDSTPLQGTALDLRVSSIHLGSERFLNTLGVDLGTRRGIFKHIQVFQENSFSEMNFSAESIDAPYLGSIIENNVLIALMQQQLAKKGQVTPYFKVALKQLELSADAVTLHLQDQTALQAKLIIGADGAHSWLRTQCGLLQEEKPYGQTALVAHVVTTMPHRQTAYQRFLVDGPLAFLPLEAPYAHSIVWSNTPDNIAALMALDDAQLASIITQAFAQRLGTVQMMSKRATFPLVMRHAKHYTATRVALVGDAIHTIHPLAGQGANLGLMDVACLTQIIALATEQGRALGDQVVLRRYARRRRLATVLMLQAMQFLAYNRKPMPHIRALLMRTVDSAPLLQQAIMRYAVGLDRAPIYEDDDD